MIPNIQKPIVDLHHLKNLQEQFETAAKNPTNGLEDADFLCELDLHTKNKSGEYMDVLTIACFNLFLAGYEQGLKECNNTLDLNG